VKNPTINDPRWQAWCDKFLSAKKVQMTDEQAESYFSIMTQDDAEFAKKVESIQGESFALKVFDNHARKMGMKADPKVRIFFAGFVAKNAGTAVMYVHALRRFQQKKGITKPLNMLDLHGHNDSPFAFGYLPEDTLHALWDEQKLTEEDEKELLGPDNYLDYVYDPEAK
jgi:hypothetical protein